MAVSYAQTTAWSAVVELAAQENSIISMIASGIYQADAENAKIIRSVSVGTPTISDYDGAITYEDLTDTNLDITMDQKKKYSFKVEDVDAAQSVPDLENPSLVEAGMALALEADKYAFSLIDGGTTNIIDDGTYGGTAGNPYAVTATNIDTVVGDAMAILDEKNAGPSRVLVVSSKVFRFIVDDARATLTDNGEVFKSGYLKDYYGFEVFKSNSLDGTGNERHCVAMSKRALPFASSVAESEMIRLESYFANAHRGLFVFGAGIKFADEIVDLHLTVA